MAVCCFRVLFVVSVDLRHHVVTQWSAPPTALPSTPCSSPTVGRRVDCIRSTMHCNNRTTAPHEDRGRTALPRCPLEATGSHVPLNEEQLLPSPDLPLPCHFLLSILKTRDQWHSGSNIFSSLACSSSGMGQGKRCRAVLELQLSFSFEKGHRAESTTSPPLPGGVKFGCCSTPGVRVQ